MKQIDAVINVCFTTFQNILNMAIKVSIQQKLRNHEGEKLSNWQAWTFKDCLFCSVTYMNIGHQPIIYQNTGDKVQ